MRPDITSNGGGGVCGGVLGGEGGGGIDGGESQLRFRPSSTPFVAMCSTTRSQLHLVTKPPQYGNKTSLYRKA